MKKLLIITLIIVFGSLDLSAKRYAIDDVPNVQIENRYRFTSNPDGILSQRAVAQIDSICYDLRHRGIAQVAVVAVKEIASDDVFDFAYKLFSKWGVGSKSDSGIGVLLVEEAREIRFITGYGVEGALPDAICKRIQTQYMLPYFRNGDYSSGMVAGVSAIRARLNGSELDAGGNDDYIDEDDDIMSIFVFIALIIFGTIFLAIYIERESRRCPNCKKVALKKNSAVLISKNFGISTYRDTFICSNCGSHIERNRDVHDSNHNRRGGGGPIIMGGGFG